MSGPGGGVPDGWCGGAKPTTPKKKIFKFLVSPAKKIEKLITSQSLRIAQKNLFMQKVSFRSVPINAANFTTSEESLIFFWEPLLDAGSTQTRYDGTWNLTPIYIFKSWRIFFVKMSTAEGWGGSLHILSWETTSQMRHSEIYIFDSFQFKRDLIVVTVFLLIKSQI